MKKSALRIKQLVNVTHGSSAKEEPYAFFFSFQTQNVKEEGYVRSYL